MIHNNFGNGLFIPVHSGATMWTGVVTVTDVLLRHYKVAAGALKHQLCFILVLFNHPWQGGCLIGKRFANSCHEFRILCNCWETSPSFRTEKESMNKVQSIWDFIPSGLKVLCTFYLSVVFCSKWKLTENYPLTTNGTNELKINKNAFRIFL